MVRRVQAERPVVRVLAIGALKPRHRATISDLSLVERRQALAFEPGSEVVHRRGARTVPVNHSAGWPTVQAAGVGQPGVPRRTVPARRIVAALLLFSVSLALHQRRVPLSLG